MVKNTFGYDDSLDVFGIHGVGGIVGAIGTGICRPRRSAAIGYATATRWAARSTSRSTRSWSPSSGAASASFILYKLVDLIVGLRVSEETEREGLDLSEHGERAYTT